MDQIEEVRRVLNLIGARYVGYLKELEQTLIEAKRDPIKLKKAFLMIQAWNARE